MVCIMQYRNPSLKSKSEGIGNLVRMINYIAARFVSTIHDWANNITCAPITGNNSNYLESKGGLKPHSFIHLTIEVTALRLGIWVLVCILFFDMHIDNINMWYRAFIILLLFLALNRARHSTDLIFLPEGQEKKLGYLPPKFITCPTCHWHALSVVTVAEI